MLFRWAWREILHNWKTSLVFILNLSLGLTGFVTLDAFNTTLKASLNENAKKMLSADIGISARRTITDLELNKTRSIVGEPLKESEMFEFFAMISSGKDSRLVMVKAVDDHYPFYGDLTLESGAVIRAGNTKKIIGKKLVWAFPELKYQLDLKPGSQVQLGQATLTIDDFVTKDSTQMFRSSAIAPKIYISREWLKETGLIQFGSTFTQTYLYQLPNDTLTEIKKQSLLTELKDPAIDIETPKTTGEDSGKQLQYLSDYLGLVALIAIFLSSLGAAYVYRLFLTRRLKEIAIYRALGLQSSEAVIVYVIQAAILGVLSLIPTMVAARLFLPLLTYLMNKLVPFNLIPQITQESFVFALVYGVFISFLITLPFILRIQGLKTSKLFNEEKFTENLSLRSPWPFLPAVIAMWALSILQAHSLKTGTIFFLMLLAVLILFFATGWFLFGLLNKNTITNWTYRYGLKSIARLRSTSVAAFMALGLGSLLINVLPQIKSSVQAEFYLNPNSKTPGLFLFDIQEEQIKNLETRLQEQDIKLLLKSPMIRARILKVNGSDYERIIEKTETFKTREEEQEARSRNRGVNLSYRTSLADSETVIDGQPITTRFDPTLGIPGKISIEQGFLERMKFHLGDQITFDVQGVQVIGQIVNVRKVKWNSFQPNFFVMVEPGFLDEAPKSYIAAIPKLETSVKNKLQNKLVKEFPNISILDVERTIQEILRVADQMSWSLELMAILALIVGYVVLFSIIRNQVLQRRWEINMLKILGASFSEVRSYLLVESLTISLMASVLGAIFSVAVSFALTTWVFGTSFALDLETPLISILGVVGISLSVSLIAAQGILKEKPLVILRESN